MTVEWRLRRTADNSLEDGLFDVEVTDAVNRFGRHATAWVDDVDGDAQSTYQRGTAVEIEVSPDGQSGFSRRFAGFVVETDVRDKQGADVLELSIYSFDHFLRRQQVDRDFSGVTISSALQAIVEDFTPVSWVASNVEVVNDETLTRGFEGETVDNAIAELASKSGDEEFGVNDDVEFFFRPRETGSAPRGIDNSQWLDFDFPERGKEAVNEVQLFYGQGSNTGSVVVRDGADQSDLQDQTGAAGPVRLREEVTREDISDEGDARDKAREILEGREPTLTGEITTFGLTDATPGDVIPVEIEAADVDGDFRIAELTYRWSETDVTVVEKRGGSQEEQLVRLTDTLDRVEQRGADRSAATTQFEGPLRATAGVQCSASIGWRLGGDSTFQTGANRSEPGFNRGEPGWQGSARIVRSSDCRLTNDYLDDLRDVWLGNLASINIDTIGVGIGPDSPSRTDASLAEETQREALDATFSIGQTSARFEATVPQPNTLIATSSGVFESVDVSAHDSVWVEIEGAQGEDGQDGSPGGNGGEGGRGAVCQGLIDVSDASDLLVIAATGQGGIDGGEDGEVADDPAGDGGAGAGSSGVVISLSDEDIVALEAGGGGGGAGGAGFESSGVWGTTATPGGDGGAGGEEFGDGAAGGEGGQAGSPDGEPGGAGEAYYDEERVSLFAGERGHERGAGDGFVRIYSQPPIQEAGLLDDAANDLKTRAVWDHDVDIHGVLERDVDVRIQLSFAPVADERATPTTRGLEIQRDATVGTDVSSEAPTAIAFGTDDTTPSVDDDSLGSRFGSASIATTQKRSAGTADATATVANSSGSAVTLREWGVENSSGDLLSRLTYADLLLEDGDELTATHRTRYSNL